MTGIIGAPMLLDGATGTNLMAAGMPQGVCAEEWILAHPQVLIDLQRGYFEAGSDAVMAPTFEANRHKLKDYGLGGKVRDTVLRLVELTRKASQGRGKIAGDVSPTGIFIEPFGEAGFDDLVDIYREQAFALREAGVDYIAIETMISLTEARAALIACRQTGLPVTVTLTVDSNGRLLTGGEAAPCLATLAAMGADAVGLNCSTGPKIILECLRRAAEYVGVPLIAKPNAGLPTEEPGGAMVYDISPEDFGKMVPAFYAIGAGILGGCCGSTPAHIASMRRAMDKNAFAPKKPVGRETAADERHIYEIAGAFESVIETGCGSSLADSLAFASSDGYTAARIRIKDINDAHEFGLNSYMSSVPVILLSDDGDALEQALMLYQGRALIDRSSDIGPEKLKELSQKYGAII